MRLTYKEPSADNLAEFEKRSADFVQVGFAPGSYLGRCLCCRETHIADKHAWRCFDCAALAIKNNNDIEALSSCGL